MRRVLALLVSSLLAVSGLSVGAPALGSPGPMSGQFLIQSSPTSGDFDVVLHRSKSGQHAVLRIKYPQVGQRVQLMRVEKSGKYKQVFSYTLEETELDALGNYAQLQSGQFIKGFKLPSSKTTYQVLVDGKEYLERKTLTKTKKALVSVNSVVVKGAEAAITGSADFSIQVRDLFEGLSLSSICLFVDDAPVSSANITSAMLGSDSVLLGPQGCLAPVTGIDSNLPLTLNYQTKSLLDGKHVLRATAVLSDTSGTPRSVQGSVSFLTDNQSLKATAPNPTFSGALMAGQTLTVMPGNWGNGVTYTYKWFLDGQLIRGATSDKYLLTYTDVGKVLKAEVTGTKNSQDKAVRTVETTSPISEQRTGSPSQGSLGQSSTSYNVVENSNVYDSVQRKYVLREVNNYNVVISHPTTVFCDTTSSYSGCTFSANVGWAGLFEDYESFFETVRLVRVSDGIEVDSDYLSLSTLSRSSDTLDFTVYSSSLRSSNNLNQFRLQIRDAGYNQTLTSNGSSTIQFIRSPNPSSSSLRLTSADKAVKGFSDSFVYRGGTSSSPAWKLWQYATPSKVLVMQTCAILPIFVAPQSLIDGSLDDWTTKNASDVTISVFGGNGLLREKISLIGSRGDWNNMALGNQVNIKVCGLNVQKDKKENLRVQFDFRYDAYNFESVVSTSNTIEMVGNMKFTKINCYQGEAGQVINAYKPVCPEGWTKTKAKIKNGKVVMTTLNCLAGRDLQVVRAPEPVCPEGYEITELKVKNGKLVPWTISCRKGFKRTTVTAVFPSCPAGYTRTF